MVARALNIAVLTRLKADMQLASPYRHDLPMRCPQGQPLAWLNYDAQSGQQWYGVADQDPLCTVCWQQTVCGREFAYEVARHETFLGMIPLNTKAGWKLVHSARSWIEAAQSFEKNQLGLETIFLNSLALTWTVSLLADSVALLRCFGAIARRSQTECSPRIAAPTNHVRILEKENKRQQNCRQLFRPIKSRAMHFSFVTPS